MLLHHQWVLNWATELLMKVVRYIPPESEREKIFSCHHGVFKKVCNQKKLLYYVE